MKSQSLYPRTPFTAAKMTAAFFGVSMLLFASTGCSSDMEAASPLDIQALAEQTTPFQQEILKDNAVSYPEYEKALLAQRSCVETAGATVGDLVDTGNNEKTFSYEVVANTKEDADRINLAADKCLEEYLVEVGKVWAYQQLLSPEEHDKQRPDVIQCLKDDGIPVEDNASYDQILEAVSTPENVDKAERCIQKYPGYFYVAPTESEHAHS